MDGRKETIDMEIQKLETPYSEITVCLDMAGCPNRCKHCWLGHFPNGNLSDADLCFVAEQFRPFTARLIVDDWYREPDFNARYKERWNLCESLSDQPRTHFELLSVWRLIRDPEYVKWLSSLGLKAAQLTLFGGETTTDSYTGRKNAYREIIEATDILIENHIAPRIQIFLNQENIDEMPVVEALITELQLEERCREFEKKFSCFIHQGTCDGENEKLYPIRVTPAEVQKIPKRLAGYTLKHFHKENLIDVFGKTEQELYEALLSDHSTASYVTDKPVFYVDAHFDVYPNLTCPAPFWLLGNLKTDSVEKVLENYAKNRSLAQSVRITVPVCELVKAQGNPASQRLFGKNDYINYLLNTYCQAKG